MANDPAGTVYAAALFESAKAKGTLDSAHTTLNELGVALAETADLRRALFNPSFADTGKKAILTKLTAGSDAPVRNLLLLLVDNGRLPALPDLIVNFDERYREANRQVELELTTAIPIADDEGERIRAELAKQSGREVALTRTVDPSILGGIILRLGDKLIDKSVRGRLDAMRLQLRSARLPGAAAPGGDN